MSFPHIDLYALAESWGCSDLNDALDGLFSLYTDVDSRIEETTRDLDLPCYKGCDACCHESVFLTPLEFLAIWAWAQTNLDAQSRLHIVNRALEIYKDHQSIIDGFESAPPEGQEDHFQTAKELRFRCPFLGQDGGCMVYPARELYARLFGMSFNDDGGIYGCHLVGEHLAAKEVTLLPASATARRLNQLPLTSSRQVLPWYLNQLFEPVKTSQT
ncbi:hypothetical protein KAI87_15055 [Myxococcota bacterium]|nr:hypothetical protein [Myxococcota bacterium]